MHTREQKNVQKMMKISLVSCNIQNYLLQNMAGHFVIPKLLPDPKCCHLEEVNKPKVNPQCITINIHTYMFYLLVFKIYF